MTSMVFALLCFTGICIMFLYLVRSLEKLQEHTRDEHAQLRVQIRALEARLDLMAHTGHTPAPGGAPLTIQAPNLRTHPSSADTHV